MESFISHNFLVFLPSILRNFQVVVFFLIATVSCQLKAQSIDIQHGRNSNNANTSISATPLNTDSSDNFHILYNKEKELLVLQCQNINTTDLEITLWNGKGEIVASTFLYQGSTIAFLDTEILYAGVYKLNISNGMESIQRQVTIYK